MAERTDIGVVAEAVRDLREGKTQEQFSAELGITRSRLANYEAGRTRPAGKVLAALKERFGVNTDSDLADALGVARSTVTNWRCRESVPKRYRDARPEPESQFSAAQAKRLLHILRNKELSDRDARVSAQAFLLALLDGSDSHGA
jgi:transcriptional regulator with XRE-family HTH domain